MNEEKMNPAPSRRSNTASRQPWEKPATVELPPLTELTLESILGNPIEGSGSTTGTPSLIFN